MNLILLIQKVLLSYDLKRNISMLFVAILLILASVYTTVVLPLDKKWMGGAGLIGGLFMFVMLRQAIKIQRKSGQNQSMGSAALETFLTFVILGFISINYLLSAAIYLDSGSYSAVIILACSGISLLFKQWVYRFVILISLSVLGISVAI